MPKASPMQQSFSAGEISPLLRSRSDFDKYQSAVQLLENYIPLIQGPLLRRSGTKFTAEVKYSSKITRLIQFEFSTTQAYMIEAGENYFRFYRNKAAILEAGVIISNVTQANPAVVTTLAVHNLVNDQHTKLDGIVGMTELNGQRFKVNVLTTTTYELVGINSTAFTAYVSDGLSSKVYEISHTYTQSELKGISFTQSADTLYLAHEKHKLAALTRTGHTNWILDADLLSSILGNGPDGPYLDINQTTTTLVSSVATGVGATITASATAGINGGLGFLSTDVGRIIRLKDGANNWAMLIIDAFTSDTVVTADIIYGPAPTVATVNFRMGLYSDTDGWPSVVAFFENRLVLGGSTFFPQRIDTSNTGDYTFFAPTEADSTVLDSNSVSLTLSSNSVNLVEYLLDDPKGLIAGTAGGQWLIRASVNGEALTPSNVNASRSSGNGCSATAPIKAGSDIIYIQRAKRKLMELSYSFDAEGFKANNLTKIAEHITATGLQEITYQEEPHSVIWAVRGDGALIGFTYEKELESFGWHKHILGGYSDAGKTITAKVKSISSIPSQAEDRDDLWLVVERHINGGTKQFVEYLTKDWEQTDLQKDAFFVDAGLSYSGAATTTISGLEHLEGETVKVLVDGAAHPDRLVNLGAITLADPASDVHVGLGYISNMKTLPIEAGAADGTAQGKIKRIHRVILRVLDLLGLETGDDEDNLTTQVFRTSNDLMDTAVPLFTGDIEIGWDGDYDTNGYIYVRQSDPLPGTILAVMPQLITQDR